MIRISVNKPSQPGWRKLVLASSVASAMLLGAPAQAADETSGQTAAPGGAWNAPGQMPEYAAPGAVPPPPPGPYSSGSEMPPSPPPPPQFRPDESLERSSASYPAGMPPRFPDDRSRGPVTRDELLKQQEERRAEMEKYMQQRQEEMEKQRAEMDKRHEEMMQGRGAPAGMPQYREDPCADEVRSERREQMQQEWEQRKAEQEKRWEEIQAEREKYRSAPPGSYAPPMPAGMAPAQAQSAPQQAQPQQQPAQPQQQPVYQMPGYGYGYPAPPPGYAPPAPGWGYPGYPAPAAGSSGGQSQ